jgi:hypothetical protein
VWFLNQRDVAQNLVGELKAERTKTLESLHKAEKAEREKTEKLCEAFLARAQAGRWSGRVGRRFDSLKALAEATQIARELDLPEERFRELRNEAIACLALADLRMGKAWDGYPPGSNGFALDAKLERYARGDEKGNISVRRVADDQEIVRLPGPGVQAHFLHFCANGQFLAAGYHHWSPPQFMVWDLGRREVVLNLAPGIHKQGFDFRADNRQVVLGRKDGTIGVYDLTSGQEVKRFSPGLQPSSPNSLRFHPDGRKLAIASRQLPGVEIRDLDTGKVTTLPHPAAVYGLA